jgi:hypothetical protein
MAKSAALLNLMESLTIADELLKIEKKYYHKPPNPTEQKPVQGLRGAAAVFVLASFERFLSDAIEEHLTKLQSLPAASFNLLPDDIRINNTYKMLEYAMKGRPHEAPKNKKDRLVDIDFACNQVITSTICPNVFTNTGSNPNSSTVKSMLKECDVNDIFGIIKKDFIKKWGVPIAHTFIKDKLDEIVYRRHVVAHTANALNITREQLKESLRFLKILSELIDKELDKKMKAISLVARVP